MGRNLVDSHRTCLERSGCQGESHCIVAVLCSLKACSHVGHALHAKKKKCIQNTLITFLAGSGTLVGPAEGLDQPSLAAEDFAFYSQKIPSVFTFLGIGVSLPCYAFSLTELLSPRISL